MKRLLPHVLQHYRSMFNVVLVFLLPFILSAQKQNCNLSVTINGQSPKCFGHSNGSITSVVTGSAGNVKYRWNNGVTSAHLSSAFAGTYSLTVSSNGCTATSNQVVLVNPPEIIVSAEAVPVSCYNSSSGKINLTVAGGTPGYAYSWSNGQSIEDVEGLMPGNYQVVVLDANHCPITKLISITQPEAPLYAHAKITAATDVQYGVIDLTVSGGTPPYKYEWSNGETSEDLNGLQQGTYTVSITDAVGCLFTKSFDLTNASVTHTITTHISASPNVIYPGFGPQSSILSAMPASGVDPFTYLWTSSNGSLLSSSASTVVSPSAATTYNVYVTDATGVGTNKSVTVDVKPVPYCTGSNKIQMCILDRRIPMVTHQECVAPSKVQDYYDKQTGWIGDCTEAASTVAVGMTAEQSMMVFEKPLTVSTTRIKVSPNPSRGKFSVLMPNLPKGKVEIRILDNSGKEVERKIVKGASEQTLIDFNIEGRSRGLYFISINTPEGSFVEKLIIK